MQARTYECRHCGEAQDADDVLSAPCAECGRCPDCAPGWVGSSHHCYECEVNILEDGRYRTCFLTERPTEGDIQELTAIAAEWQVTFVHFSGVQGASGYYGWYEFPHRGLETGKAVLDILDAVEAYLGYAPRVQSQGGE